MPTYGKMKTGYCRAGFAAGLGDRRIEHHYVNAPVTGPSSSVSLVAAGRYSVYPAAESSSGFSPNFVISNG